MKRRRILRKREAGFARDLFIRVVEAIVKALLMFGYRAPGKIIKLVKTIILAMVGKGNVSGTLKAVVNSLKNKGIFRSLGDLDLNYMGMVDDVVHEFMKTKRSNLIAGSRLDSDTFKNKVGVWEVRRSRRLRKSKRGVLSARAMRKLRLNSRGFRGSMSHRSYQDEIEFEDDMQFDERVFKLEKWEKVDPEVYEKILDTNRDILADHEGWADTELDLFKVETEKSMLFEPENILFSGFWSQGDGASFEGDLDGEATANFIVKFKLRKYFPLITLMDEGLVEILMDLNRMSSHNVHALSITTTCEDEWYLKDEMDEAKAIKILVPGYKLPPEPQEYELETILEDLMNDILLELQDDFDKLYRIPACQDLYNSLREEYEYYTSDSRVAETLRENGYYFNAEGQIV